jgi:hypothetical protein
MKRLEQGKKYKFDARSLAEGGTRDKVLILDGHDIEKYRCRFDIEGVDLTEFERTGGQGFFGHDTSQPPICDWKLWKEHGALWGVPTFHGDLNPAAAVIEKLWNADKINAVSIGIDVIETVDNREDEYTTISKSAPYEVSIVNFGAHPHAGKNLTLSAAVADGVITEGEADLVADAEADITEGTPERTELETLREENARLLVELEAARKPDAPPAIDLQKINLPEKTNPTGAQVREQLVAQVREQLSRQLVPLVRAAVRKHLGRVD